MRYKLIYALTLIMLLSSCHEDRDTFKSFLTEVSMEINAKKLNDFGDSDLNDSLNSMELVYDEIYSQIKELPQNDKISIFLDSICGKSKYAPQTKTEFVAVALHNQMNEKSLIVDDIVRAYKLYKKSVLEARYEKEDEIQRDIQKLNDQFYKIGDTISVILRIDDDFGKKRITYNNLVSDSVYFSSSFHNKSVKLMCIIEKKFLDTKPNGDIDPSALVFDCQLLKSSDYDVYQSEVKLIQGGKINIYVSSYGRVLGKASTYDSWVIKDGALQP